MSTPTYEISSERFVNEEGSEFVTVTITWPGTELEERTLFASYFDDPVSYTHLRAHET